ncbi:amyloid-beta A4 precursor protein-binding family A member 1 isoform X1 [Lethenteron reissneri]|uniref:amyloid-beta A4 precursor protein-binding family A member 1 isoform X1 n=1 Tax=Lethenteron reissneri TaxID=7753 RepID=UPI002AB69932|nr:amyloid-beta A4 precursor protein-binding family A member 1 isoform X1 [Lethenteron reissneri]
MDSQADEREANGEINEYAEADLEHLDEAGGRRVVLDRRQARPDGAQSQRAGDSEYEQSDDEGRQLVGYENEHLDDDGRTSEYDNEQLDEEGSRRAVESDGQFYGEPDGQSAEYENEQLDEEGIRHVIEYDNYNHSDEEGGPSEDYENDHLAGEGRNEVHYDSEQSEEEAVVHSVEYEQQMYARVVHVEPQDLDRNLARSGSTESGFHNHTDTAEDDLSSEYATVRDHDERLPENDDENVYSVEYRPEAEEYLEQAESEHAPMSTAVQPSQASAEPASAAPPSANGRTANMVPRVHQNETRSERRRPNQQSARRSDQQVPEQSVRRPGPPVQNHRSANRPERLPQNTRRSEQVPQDHPNARRVDRQQVQQPSTQSARPERQPANQKSMRAPESQVTNLRNVRRPDRPQPASQSNRRSDPIVADHVSMRPNSLNVDRQSVRRSDPVISLHINPRRAEAPVPDQQVVRQEYQGVEEAYRVFHPRADHNAEEHVYEEIGDHPVADTVYSMEPYEQEREEEDDYDSKQVLGARLHHYDVKSDSESDSPEKDAEYTSYPAPDPDSDEEHEEEDIDQIVAEVKQSLSSKSLDRIAQDMPESEQEQGAGAAHSGAESRTNEVSVVSREQREAISLALKDIQDAIAEVKTKTMRSPYTPEEPAEPIWVMRNDQSPPRELENGIPGESPVSPVSPSGMEAGKRQQRSDLNAMAGSDPARDAAKTPQYPSFVDVPGPCDPEDLIDGIIFAANYLGSTQLLSEKNPSKNVRMMQAQEAVSRIKRAQKLAKSKKKAPEGESQPMTEVDLFISTQRIKVLNADTQETMMDHALRTISYIADIGNIVVLMARRRIPRTASQEGMEASHPGQDSKRQYKMICHVFESEDAQLIAQSIGQAFSVAYQEFLRANGINPEDLSQKDYSELLNTQEMYNDDLIHFSKSENSKEIIIEKQKGEILGITIVESGWGSILPTVIIANLMHGGPATRSGKLNIGDQIMSINGTSLVGLPLSTCQTIIKGLKNQTMVKVNIVSCPPVTSVLIKRPDLKYQLGFSVQNGIICSLMRGGIAERGGVRVGHRIIEINGQSVVATPHEKIVHALSNAVGEIHMKTMPAAMYRLLTGQEQPVYF